MRALLILSALCLASIAHAGPMIQSTSPGVGITGAQSAEGPLTLTCTGCAASLVVAGASDFKGALSNSGASNGGAVALSDSLRFLSTTTATLESSTAATGGSDIGFQLSALVDLSGSDYVLQVGDSASSTLLRLAGAGTLYTAGAIISGTSFLSTTGTYSTTAASVPAIFEAAGATAAGATGAAVTHRSGSGAAGSGATPGGPGGVTTNTTGVGGAGTASAAAGASGALVLTTGAAGANNGGGGAASGAITLDPGAPTGAATAGTVTIAGTNASALNLGRATVVTTISGSPRGAWETAAGVAGLSATITVRDQAGTGTCTLTVANGLITATTCP